MVSKKITEMNFLMKKIFKFFLFFTLIFVLHSHSVAQSPTFMYCTKVSDQSATLSEDPVLKNALRFAGVYYNPDYYNTDNPNDKNVHLQGEGTFYTNESRYLDEGYFSENVRNRVTSFADPWNFRTSIFNEGFSINNHSFVNTGSGVSKWFVLKGPNPNVPVNLRVDILFDGYLFGDFAPEGGDASAFFTHILNVVNSPTDRVVEYPLVINGAARPPGDNFPCGPFGQHGTVPDQCFINDGHTIHRVYYIIRSNPFTVLTDVPFRLRLMLNAAAGTAGEGQLYAYTSFSLSRIALAGEFPDITELSPEGFVVDLDGNPATRDVATLSSLGYQLIPFSEPSITSIFPTKGGDTRPVTVTITGDGFLQGAQVKLSRAGEADIVGTVGKIERNKIMATFNLEGKTRGTWDLVLTNLPAYPTSPPVILPGAFTIEEGRAPQVWMDIMGRNEVSIWGGYLKILMGNRGNVDAIGTPVIHGIPKGTSWVLYKDYSVEPTIYAETEEGVAILLPTTIIPPGVILELGLSLGWMSPTLGQFNIHAVWEE